MKVEASPSRSKAATRERESDFTLTRRELDVARLIARGLTAKMIAETLGISAHTATRHTESIMRKMKVTSRVAVAAYILTKNSID